MDLQQELLEEQEAREVLQSRRGYCYHRRGPLDSLGSIMLSSSSSPPDMTSVRAPFSKRQQKYVSWQELVLEPEEELIQTLLWKSQKKVQQVCLSILEQTVERKKTLVQKGQHQRRNSQQ